MDEPIAEPTEEEASALKKLFKSMRGETDALRLSQALRVWAASTEPFDADEQAEYGVNADGTPIEGGLTARGAQFAEHVMGHIGEAVPAFKSRAEGKSRRRRGERGEIAAALRAGAQALVSALDGDDDDDDDEGGREWRDAEGRSLRAVTLGRRPYVLVQMETDPGGDDSRVSTGAMSVLVGGGVKYGRHMGPGDDVTLNAETILRCAAGGVAAQDAGKSGVVMTSDGRVASDNADMPPEIAEAFLQMMAEVNGITIEEARQQFGADLGGLVPDPEAWPGGSQEASGAGPSTEMPTMPTPAPDHPSVPDFPETPAAPAPSRDDGPASSGGMGDATGSAGPVGSSD